MGPYPEKIDIPKSECLLPNTVAKIIANGEKSVKVLVADDRWYGVTYKEDKQSVMDALKAKTEQGIYPAPLWK